MRARDRRRLLTAYERERARLVLAHGSQWVRVYWALHPEIYASDGELNRSALKARQGAAFPQAAPVVADEPPSLG